MAAQRHGGDYHWSDIWCRECGTWITEYYDKGYYGRPDDLCDSCERKQERYNAVKSKWDRHVDRKRRRYEAAKETAPEDCVVCPKTFNVLQMYANPNFYGVDELSAWCGDCEKIHDNHEIPDFDKSSDSE